MFLDRLWGVATLLVIWCHVFEGFVASPVDQEFSHGCLAVGFFLILSDFVIGYVYNDRWKITMTQKESFKRRLIRLYPVVVMGAALGTIIFYIRGYERWDGTRVSISTVMVAMLLNLFLIPAIPGTGPEIHENDEIYPLNGPSWSLFFEYIDSVLYALFIRRVSTKTLTIFVIIAGTELVSLPICSLSGSYRLGVDWSMIDYNLVGGFLYVLFVFSAELLMPRIFRPVHIKGTFWVCSLSTLILLTMPYVGSETSPWADDVYDVVCTILIFPLPVYLDVSGKTTDKSTARIYKSLGNISYPVYIIRYPFIYLSYAWLRSKEPHITFSQSWPVALCVLPGGIVLAYLCLKLYDEPVRKWLSEEFLVKEQGNCHNREG